MLGRKLGTDLEDLKEEKNQTQSLALLLLAIPHKDNETEQLIQWEDCQRDYIGIYKVWGCVLSQMNVGMSQLVRCRN